MKPKDGIKYLIGIGHLMETPQSIANFLFMADGLEKEQVRRRRGERYILILFVTYDHTHTGWGIFGWEA